jgi:N-carbamoyl-L-amino-acid hydrolase
MMGSLLYVGGLQLSDLGDEVLEALAPFAGPAPLPGPAPHAFVELHIEQGPILNVEGVDIGVVTDVQGISWQRVVLGGQSNHAGTAPMRLRRDAALDAARLVHQVNALATGDAVATVGSLQLFPGLINVVANRAELTVDLRSPDEGQLSSMDRAFDALLESFEVLERERLVRLKPVRFDPVVVDAVEQAAASLGLSHRRMVSGAGHDAQMFARVCPAAMVFVPSVGGISHNVLEHTEPHHVLAGATVLAQVLLELSA